MPDAFDLPPLPYDAGPLAPTIDTATLAVHHDGHHRAYVDALNAALAPYPELHGRSIEALLSGLDALPAGIQQVVRQAGGGHANHQLFWKGIRTGGRLSPTGDLAAMIERDFGSAGGFAEAFVEAGLARFGSGWAFLVTDPHGQALEIVALPDEGSVLLPPGGRPALLAADLWEHAYYPSFRQDRATWLRGWLGLVNWDYAEERLQAIRAGETDRLGGPAI